MTNLSTDFEEMRQKAVRRICIGNSDVYVEGMTQDERDRIESILIRRQVHSVVFWKDGEPTTHRRVQS